MINIHLCAFCWNFKVVLFYLKADVDHCFCCFGIGKLEISELCSYSNNNRTRFEASGIKNNERGNPNSKIVACGYLEHSHQLFSNRFRFAADFFCSPFYVPVVYTRFAIFFKDFSSKKHKICKITRQLRRKWEIILHAVCSQGRQKQEYANITNKTWKCVSYFPPPIYLVHAASQFRVSFLLDMIQRS